MKTNHHICIICWAFEDLLEICGHLENINWIYLIYSQAVDAGHFPIVHHLCGTIFLIPSALLQAYWHFGPCSKHIFSLLSGAVLLFWVFLDFENGLVLDILQFGQDVFLLAGWTSSCHWFWSAGAPPTLSSESETGVKLELNWIEFLILVFAIKGTTPNLITLR